MTISCARQTDVKFSLKLHDDVMQGEMFFACRFMHLLFVNKLIASKIDGRLIKAFAYFFERWTRVDFCCYLLFNHLQIRFEFPHQFF